tara:strand:+ start:2738 stop:5173 length:2436 start_codon:yes stop_codon:yes gene_type:complete
METNLILLNKVLKSSANTKFNDAEINTIRKWRTNSNSSRITLIKNLNSKMQIILNKQPKILSQNQFQNLDTNKWVEYMMFLSSQKKLNINTQANKYVNSKGITLNAIEKLAQNNVIGEADKFILLSALSRKQNVNETVKTALYKNAKAILKSPMHWDQKSKLMDSIRNKKKLRNIVYNDLNTNQKKQFDIAFPGTVPSPLALSGKSIYNVTFDSNFNNIHKAKTSNPEKIKKFLNFYSQNKNTSQKNIITNAIVNLLNNESLSDPELVQKIKNKIPNINKKTNKLPGWSSAPIIRSTGLRPTNTPKGPIVENFTTINPIVENYTRQYQMSNQPNLVKSEIVKVVEKQVNKTQKQILVNKFVERVPELRQTFRNKGFIVNQGTNGVGTLKKNINKNYDQLIKNILLQNVNEYEKINSLIEIYKKSNVNSKVKETITIKIGELLRNNPKLKSNTSLIHTLKTNINNKNTLAFVANSPIHGNSIQNKIIQNYVQDPTKDCEPPETGNLGELNTLFKGKMKNKSHLITKKIALLIAQQKIKQTDVEAYSNLQKVYNIDKQLRLIVKDNIPKKAGNDEKCESPSKQISDYLKRLYGTESAMVFMQSLNEKLLSINDFFMNNKYLNDFKSVYYQNFTTHIMKILFTGVFLLTAVLSYPKNIKNNSRAVIKYKNEVDALILDLLKRLDGPIKKVKSAQQNTGKSPTNEQVIMILLNDIDLQVKSIKKDPWVSILAKNSESKLNIKSLQNSIKGVRNSLFNYRFLMSKSIVRKFIKDKLPTIFEAIKQSNNKLIKSPLIGLKQLLTSQSNNKGGFFTLI